MSDRAAPKVRTRLWASLLSLIAPGLGQAFGGEYRRGVIFLVVAFAAGLPIVASVYAFPTWSPRVIFALMEIGLGGGLLLGLWAAIDAFRQYGRTGSILLSRGRRYAIYAAFLLIALVPLDSLFGLREWSSFSVPSGSMTPALLIGDNMWAAGKYYRDHKPQRGDIAVFELPADRSIDYVKRVIGVPGDRIQLKHGILYINDVAVPRVEAPPYVGRAGRFLQYRETLPGGVSHTILMIGDEQSSENTDVFDVPAGHYFMMGDNRDNSLDSRFAGDGVGFVPEENFKARAGLIYFSTDGTARWWQVWKWPHAVRWHRIGGGLYDVPS